MESKTNRIVNLRPPTQGTTPGTGITRLATSTAASNVDMAETGSAMFGKHLRLYNEDATNSIWVAFSATNATPISSATAGGATLAAGTAMANAYRIAPGEAVDVRLTAKFHRYLHLQASAATPVLCIYPVAPGIAGA